MAKLLSTTAPVGGTTPAPMPDDERFRRGIGTQKPRTLPEEKAAWGRRLRRWRRKNTGPDGKAALEAAMALDPSTLSKDSTGLALLRFKANAAIGADATEAAFRAVMPYRNGDA